ncbi:MAG: hypothetical protein JW973_06840 [Bacteroidales bacterium]|nr:hypothetical protein [Bacteroidales bacterium]MBN2812634.1 hypothetical protein [Bacteroidales bacterium]
MTYIEQYEQLKEIFDLDRTETTVPESNIRIVGLSFESTADIKAMGDAFDSDSNISQNMRFRYPVLMPADKKKVREVIVLLHGLNERSWHKHLTGAQYLAEKTGKAVIMFPLSFHINRGLPEWTDTRKMAALLEIRKKKYPGVRESTLANLALSERLTENPGRFFVSGWQSAMDLLRLMQEIKEGRHPLFETGTKIDLFAYSISCMMIQSLMISNPFGILNESKIVFFAGGSLFSYMSGISRFIMDSVASDSLGRFHKALINRGSQAIKTIKPLIIENNLGRAFLSLITAGKYQRDREKALAAFGPNLMVIALRDDRIMPVEGIRQATGEKFFRSGQFKTVHFPYPYSHENPFPVLYRKFDEQVDKAFRSVFEPALRFYTQ